jgi:hypothetical protein
VPVACWWVCCHKRVSFSPIVVTAKQRRIFLIIMFDNRTVNINFDMIVLYGIIWIKLTGMFV